MRKTIFGQPPSKSNGYRIFHNIMYKTDVVKNYEKSFFIQCSERNRNLEGYFELHMDVFYASQRLDLDGSLKIILDSFQNCGVFKNDNKCVLLNIRKFVDKVNPRIEYEIKEVVL